MRRLLAALAATTLLLTACSGTDDSTDDAAVEAPADDSGDASADDGSDDGEGAAADLSLIHISEPTRPY